MKPAEGTMVRKLKRLKTAVGYHELGMTRHALRCLDSLAQLGRIGPFTLVADVLRDEFVQKRENSASAAKALEIVACMLPTAGRHAVQLTLATCYGQSGDTARSVNTAAIARGAKSAQPKPAC